MSRLDAELASQIANAVEILKEGGIVAYPTDTVYGVGADVFNTGAIAKVYEVKRRPHTLPLPVLIAEAEQVELIATSVSSYAWHLMRHFWPGGLTLVLPKSDSLSDIVTAGGDKVAVRLPGHIVPLAIIRGLGKPIIGTSANISNDPSPLTAQEVEQQLAGQVDLIIDAGSCPGGVESTVVDVTGVAPVVLRQGIVLEEDIMKVFQEYDKEVRR